jgi:ribosomal-protein-alanine N-acetyltransferase
MAATAGVTVRPLVESDLNALDRIQDSAEGASRWPVRDYLAYETIVAAAGSSLIGFLACRWVGPGEREVLNLAVDPAWRRRGVGRTLLQVETARPGCTLWLEVRAGNLTAINFYKSLGFQEISRRRSYYSGPQEDAIVMAFSS